MIYRLKILATGLLFVFSNRTSGQSQLEMTKCTKDSIGIYTEVTSDAKFIEGGILGLMSFINENVSFNANYDEELPNTILIRLIIYSDGTSKAIEINKSPVLNYEELSLIEKEYLRVIETLSDWKPAKCLDNEVDSYLIINMNISCR